MTFQKFPEYMYEIVSTGPTTELGSMEVPLAEYGELYGVYVSMVFNGTSSFTNERLRLKIERNFIPSTPIYSQWITPANIQGFTDDDAWIGNVRFLFNDEVASGNISTRLESENYTHASGGTEIGAIMNFIDNSTGQFDVDITAAYSTLFINI